jgi:hypothetical protein
MRPPGEQERQRAVTVDIDGTRSRQGSADQEAASIGIGRADRRFKR